MAKAITAEEQKILLAQKREELIQQRKEAQKREQMAEVYKASQNNYSSNNLVKSSEQITKKYTETNYSNIKNTAQRPQTSTQNLYSADKLKNAQYEYDIMMRTPSSFAVSVGSNTNLAGVVGAQFGRMTKSLSRSGLNIAKAGAINASMGINDPGARYTFDIMKYSAKTTSALGGDLKAITQRANATVKNAMQTIGGTNKVNLLKLKDESIKTHFGNNNLLSLSDEDITKGCVSLLRSKGVTISDEILTGKTFKSLGQLNKLVGQFNDEEIVTVIEALRKNTFRKGLNIKDLVKAPHFRLLGVGTALSSELKHKFLSNEELKGLSTILRTKDRINSLVKNSIRFFHNVKISAQKAAKLATRAALKLKKTRIYQTLYKKQTQKLIKRYAKKGGKQLEKRIAKRTAEQTAKASLRIQMKMLAEKLLRKAASKVITRLAATKVGQFVITKIGESAIVAAVSDFLAKFVPVVGQIYFVVEVVIIVLLIVFIGFAAITFKTAIDNIGNVASIPNEQLLDYGKTLQDCSKEYNEYYIAVTTRDSNGKLYEEKEVPKLISYLTKDIKVTFNDYLSVDSYNSSSVNGKYIRSLYGNQPELFMMPHVMTNFGMYHKDNKLQASINAQLKQLYNSSKLMYVTYYQIPTKEHIKSNDIVEIYELEYKDDHYEKKLTAYSQEEWEALIQGLNPSEMSPELLNNTPHETILGFCNKESSTLDVLWKGEVTIDTYYYDSLFDYSDMLHDDQYSSHPELAAPQVFIKYNQGANSVRASSALNHNNEYVNQCIPKVYSAVCEKLNEKGLNSADPMAITMGIVANLISEGGCRGDNYEDSWADNQNTTDYKVTEFYNKCLQEDSFGACWEMYAKNNPCYAGGYGIVQWTDSERKKGLFKKAYYWPDNHPDEIRDISNIDMQIEYMLDEMDEYKYFEPGGIFATGESAQAIGYYLCEHYENPATDGTDSKYKYRGNVAQGLYNQFNGIVGDVDYDNEKLNEYVQHLSEEDHANNYILAQADEEIETGIKEGQSLSQQTSDTMIQDYLSSQGYRMAPGAEITGYNNVAANIFYGNYGPDKGIDALESGDIIAWKNYAAIYIGNGKVLCTQHISTDNDSSELIGKFFLSDILKIFGSQPGNYVVVSPIKDDVLIDDTLTETE